MKFKYLGTAAAECIPALFCECEICKRAREKGGKDIRTRSQALIDSEMLIDFSSDTNMHMLKYGIDLSKIHHCIITHAHSDHLYVDNINMRRPMFSNIYDRKPFNIYGSKEVINKIEHDFEGKDVRDDNVARLVTVKPFEKFSVLDFEITALPARHAKHSGPFIYMIRKNEKCMLYAHDTGVFLEEVFEYFRVNRVYFDFVSLDCTEAMREIDYDSHMNVKRNIEVRDRLYKNANADKNTLFYLNHFSHNGENVLHDELEKAVASEGFHVAYDGLEIEFI